MLRRASQLTDASRSSPIRRQCRGKGGGDLPGTMECAFLIGSPLKVQSQVLTLLSPSPSFPSPLALSSVAMSCTAFTVVDVHTVAASVTSQSFESGGQSCARGIKHVAFRGAGQGPPPTTKSGRQAFQILLFCVCRTLCVCV